MSSRGGPATTIMDDDFVARAVGCEKDPTRNCEREMTPWFDTWKTKYDVKHSHGQF